MKHGSNSRRGRSRGGGKRHSSPRNQTFDSNGPEGKVRGTPQQILDKYLSLARDAVSAGEHISAEAFYQFAEHYYRVLNADQQYRQRMAEAQQQSDNDDSGSDSADDRSDNETEQSDTGQKDSDGKDQGAEQASTDGGDNGNDRPKKSRSSSRRRKNAEPSADEAEASGSVSAEDGAATDSDVGTPSTDEATATA